MDKIIIDSLKIFAYHGVNPEETQMGKWFVLDIEAWADLTNACATDELDDTVSYAAIIKTVKRTMTKKNCAWARKDPGHFFIGKKLVIFFVKNLMFLSFSCPLGERINCFDASYKCRLSAIIESSYQMIRVYIMPVSWLKTMPRPPGEVAYSKPSGLVAKNSKQSLFP